MNDDDSSFLSENSTASTPTKNPINPKIMLVTIIVLFIAVVAVMCFHSYSRWLSERRLLLLLSTDSHGTDPRPPTSGIDVSVLKSLPSFTFSSKHIPCKCAVCLSEFEEGDMGRQLPNCGHAFHMACIDKWFGSNASCPLCRGPVDRRGKEVVQTVEEDDVQATAGDSAPQFSLSRTYYSSCSCLVGKEEEGIPAEELRPEKMEERCKELEKMGFCLAECKRSENRVPSLKRIWSV